MVTFQLDELVEAEFTQADAFARVLPASPCEILAFFFSKCYIKTPFGSKRRKKREGEFYLPDWDNRTD